MIFTKESRGEEKVTGLGFEDQGPLHCEQSSKYGKYPNKAKSLSQRSMLGGESCPLFLQSYAKGIT